MSNQQRIPGFDYYHRGQSNSRYMTSDNLMYYFFNYRGRISRSEYWFGTAFIWCITLIISFFIIYFSRSMGSSILAWRNEMDIIASIWQLGTGLIFLGCFSLITIMASYMLAIKRAHDCNNPGWFVLFTLLPIANIWVFIELGFFRGTDGDNLYGDDPCRRFGVPAYAGYPNASGQAAGYQGQGQAAYGANAPYAAQAHSGPILQPGPGHQRRQDVRGPVLVAMSGEYAGRKVPIDAHGLVIGRDPQRCNLIMASKDISRVHARVTCLLPEKKFLVEDLQSRNGIFLGRERIQGKAMISSGESFTLSEDAATFMVSFS